MLRSGKYQKIIATLLVMSWCLVLITPLRADLTFFSIVQQVCKSYRVPVTMDQMDLGSEDTTFTLALQSRRNNFEEVMLVVYIASGQAIKRTGLEIKTIHITITIPNADNMLLMTTADISLVEQLRQGEIKSSEFIRQLDWN